MGTTRARTILALGGGGFLMEPDNPRLDDAILEATGKDHPRIGLLPTPSADSERVIARFYDAFARKAEAWHLPLFQRDREVAQLLEQDAIFVSGGNTANALVIWRRHGVDAVLRQAWEAGIVLAGVSAGAICWFEDGLTDSFGPELAPLGDGLGWLPGSFCPHYDGESKRRPRYTSLVDAGALPPGLALDDGVAARFEGTELVELVASRPSAAAWRVAPGAHEALPIRRLGSRLTGR